VVLPLNSRVTAGLLVLQRSALLGRPVIATETPATAAYFPEPCRDFLVPMGNPERLADVIKQYWVYAPGRLHKARLAQEHLIQHYSPASFAEQVSRLLH
jgi:hypothetical protein